MKRTGLAIIIVIILLGLTGIIVQAQDFPQPQGFVNDFAYLLSEDATVEIENFLAALEEDTSAEVAVVIVESLEEYTIEEYAVNLFQDWGIGKKDKDNGVLFLIAYEESEVRIEVGYGMEGVITDGRAGRILDREVIPYFRDGDYESGIINGVIAIEGYIRDGTALSIVEENPVQGIVSKFRLPIPLIIVLGIITIYILGFMARTKSIWLGGIWGVILGLILGFGWGNLLAIIFLPIGLGILGTMLDAILSSNYRGRRSGGQSTGWLSSRGGFSRPSGSSFHFGGGRSGGGGASRKW